MNDPGLDDPINDASAEVKHSVEPDDASDLDEETEETNFLQPARWWYASTAIPLIAGTFGPMANAFSICALVEDWREEIPKGGTVEHGNDIADPTWLIAVNAVSLVIALVANLALLLNMARRLSFKIAQPITIIGFWIASIMLIALIAVAAHHFHAPGVQNQALTQAYYYAIFAAGLYQIISYLMCFTVWGAYKGHYSKEFKLTISQRTLMLQTMSYLVYVLLGALVYSKIEGWKFLDAVYWADFTTLTIGIGDEFVPVTHLGRGLLFPYAIGGIIVLGLVVGSIRSMVLDRGAKKLSVRVEEKTRRRVVKRINKANELAAKGVAKTSVKGLDNCTAAALTIKPTEDSEAELHRRRAEFEAMRQVQELAAKKKKWMSLLTSTLAFALLWFVGAWVFYKTETTQNWSYFESLYFSYTTLLTIGYGDFEPLSNSGKPFFVFWSLLAIPTLTILISNMGDTVVKFIKDATIWVGEISVLPSEEGGAVDRLKWGIHRATAGRIDLIKPDSSKSNDDYSDSDDGFANFQEMNPGVAHVYVRGRKHGHKKHDLEANEQMTKKLEDTEKRNEKIARDHGDKIAEDEHHYRHILISQIRKVYGETNSSVPKKYSYAEWAYFLKLLGEDESDVRFHRCPPVKVEPSDRGGEKDIPNTVGTGDTSAKDKLDRMQEAQQKSGRTGGPGKDEAKITRWSWMGNRSPLMGEQHEPDWLLEKLLMRLEESLRKQWKAYEKEKKKKGKGKTDDGRDRTAESRDIGKEEEEEEEEGTVVGEQQPPKASRQSSGTLDGDRDDVIARDESGQGDDHDDEEEEDEVNDAEIGSTLTSDADSERNEHNNDDRARADGDKGPERG